MPRRERINHLAMVGRHRAQALGHALYLLEDTATGALRLSADPEGASRAAILEVCRPNSTTPVWPWC